MPTYTNKIVNGVLTTCNSTDQTVLATRDAGDWTGNPGAPSGLRRAATTNADKLTRMAKAFGMTADELKVELAKS